jgi:16S rRNA (cytidine1402-2'-O)-methyltransferase
VVASHEGALVLIATPIGNLADISARAIEELGRADLILCEDTRHSGILFRHYGITAPTTSYGSHNIHGKIPWVLEQLQQGKRLALVCDAGTPGISDPGSVLVSAALENGYKIEAIPGASALIMALILSGLPTDRFVFEGFLPHKKGRLTRLTELADEPRTIVLYESPHRLLKTLSELHMHLGDRKAAVGRELTKIFEETRRGTLSELANYFTSNAPRGEFVLIIAGTHYRDRKSTASPELYEIPNG